MNAPINTLKGQIEIDTTRDVFSSIRALDIGISNHEAWISQVHQSLICEHSHPNPADLDEDAHCRCKLGQWLYSSGTEVLKEYDVFNSVVEKHRQMHMLARHVLKKSENQQKIEEEEYSGFTSQAMAFKLEVRNLQYELMSQVCVVDHLTGAWNRYSMFSKLNQEKERQLRTGHPCTICMMDIDHFKYVNDNHGHQEGDLVLKTVVDFCRASLRKYDSIYRYGGDEFLFCLPDAKLDESRTVIERLCASLGQLQISLPNGDELFVNASFGLACLQKDTSVEDAIQAADHALLSAKTQGRNCVCCWDEIDLCVSE